MATWYAVIRKSDKKHISTASVVPKPDERKPEYEYRILPQEPDLNKVEWSPLADAFISRPPKILVDRWEELKVHADFSTGWGKVISVDKTSMEKAIIEMLGTERFRNQAESFNIGV